MYDNFTQLNYTTVNPVSYQIVSAYFIKNNSMSRVRKPNPWVDWCGR